MRRDPALRSAVLLAVVCGLVTVLVPWEPLRILAALPLVFFLPGFALTAAVFGRRRLDRGREWLLSLTLSLVLLALGSLVLSAVGIYTGTWALLLVLITAGGCAVEARRHGAAPVPAGGRRRQRRRRRLRRRDGALVVGAVLLATAAVVLSQVPFKAGNADGYTALWMLPGRGGRSVEVGVSSAQQTPWSYVLDVRPAGGRPIARSFRLDPGEEQTFRLRLPAARGGEPLQVTASLYRRGDRGRPYRQVVSWVSRGGAA